MIASGLATICQRIISPNSGQDAREKFSRELAYLAAANIALRPRRAGPSRPQN